MRRSRSVFLTLLLASAALCQTVKPALEPSEWLSVWMQGAKIGYSSYAQKDEADGRYAESVSVLDGLMLGFDLKMRVSSRTWSDRKGLAKRMEFDLESGGRLQKVVAVFQDGKVLATSTTDGRTSEKAFSVPEGAVVVDDPLVPFLQGEAPSDVYVFDPNTLTLVKCRVTPKGKQSLESPAGKTEATVLSVEDPRAPVTVYLSAKGDFLKATGPFGMEILPRPKRRRSPTLKRRTSR